MSWQINIKSNFFQRVFIFLLTIILLVGLLPYAHIRLGSTEFSALEDDDLFGGRYLVADDDRHNDGPNPNESTNNPTIFGYTRSPSVRPTLSPSVLPSSLPSDQPSSTPSLSPSSPPSLQPTILPSFIPTLMPSLKPSLTPTLSPTVKPSNRPTSIPSLFPSKNPSNQPSSFPSGQPSSPPSLSPSSLPSLQPTNLPSTIPSSIPSLKPSLTPTLLPTVQPSIEPSGAPSLQPSIEPSGEPSLQPSYDPCRGFYGYFGEITSGSIITVTYEYGIEFNKIVEANLNATLSDQVREVETAMLELLIEALFPDCKDLSSESIAQRFLHSIGNEFESILPPHSTMPDNIDREKQTIATEELEDVERENSDIEHYHSNIFSSLPRKKKPNVMKDVTVRHNDGDSHIIGITSSPIDLANGKKCQIESSSSPTIKPDCNVIEGRLELNLSELSYAASATTETRQNIKEIMDDGLLDESHPAILSVMFMQDSRLELRPRSVGDDDDDITEVDTIAPIIGNRYTWMAAAGGLVAMTALTSGTRYRYSAAQQQRVNSQVPGLDTEEFVEVESRDLVNEIG